MGNARVSVQHPVAIVADESQRAEVEATVVRRFKGWGGIICGAPSEIADALTKEVELGVERFVIQLWDFATVDSIEMFAREIIPLVQ